jgi:transcriptional regulator with XRE-family HTH domain
MRTVAVNGERLKQLRGELSYADLRKKTNMKISESNLRLLESGGRRAFPATIKLLAKALGVNYEALLAAPPREKFRRDIRGAWRVQAVDIAIPGVLEYRMGPKQLALTIEVGQDGRRVWGAGIDEDRDPVEVWEAEFSDDWCYISGRHLIRSERVYLNGVFFLKYVNIGDWLRGFYIQRETDHESDFAFGTLDLRRLN